MAGTAAVEVKTAFRDALLALAADESSPLAGWQIQYVIDDKRLERRAVILGRLAWVDTQRVTTGADRRPRDERITLALSLRIYAPGGDQATIDAELVAAGTAIEELIATRDAPSIPAVSIAGIVGGELDYWAEDAGIASVMDLTAWFARPYKR